MKIIGLVGFIGSGKDTVAGMLLDRGGHKDSFAAPLKDLVSAVFGWPRELLEGDTIESRDFRETPDIFWTRKTGIDNFTPRMALQLIGTDVMREHFHKNIWLNSLEYRMRSANKNSVTVISDVRFRNELDLITDLGGVNIWVRREELPPWYDIAVRANNGSAVDRHVMRSRHRDVHASEWDWIGYDFDYEIHNTGTLDDLEKKVADIYDSMTKSQLRAV